MKRSAAFEFPEYVDWRPDPAVQAAYVAKITADSARAARIAALDEAALLGLYEGLLGARLHDIQLKRWVKNGVISKAWLGSGEEAVTIGACAGLGPTDVVSPMIRNAGALLARGLDPVACFAAYLGTTDTHAQGRDMHIGDLALGIVPPISHVGDVVAVMAGCALAFKQRSEPRVALAWTGDGSTATGVVHEGLRVAAALRLPFICVIQNNQVALGTRTEAHFPGDFAGFGRAYGCQLLEVDGNHVLDCYAATAEAAAACRAGEGPVILVATTFRMGGHATHDEREGRALFDASTWAYWGQRDPIGCYETWLIEGKGIEPARLAAIEAAVGARIEAAAAQALSRRESHAPDPATVTHGVYG
jgi:2-oxoisovalerate dehydrogenase E1 component